MGLHELWQRSGSSSPVAGSLIGICFWASARTESCAGEFFTTLRREVHVVEDFDDTRAREWFCAMDYGFTHYTVVLLGCTDGDGNLLVVDEHAERLWVLQAASPTQSRILRGPLLVP